MKTINTPILAATGIAILFLYGCASIPKSPALDQARDSYAQAETNADVQKYASVSLYDAKLALQKAEGAKKADEQAHLAYIAKRQSEIAIVTGQRKRIEASLESMTEQRNQMRIQLSKQEAQSANVRVKQLETELADAKKTDRGLVLTLGDVVFDTGKADLAAGAYRTIDKLVDFLQANPQRYVAVEGHTDSRGNDDTNMELSQRRAEAVAMAIASRGISRDRISVRGFGESSPIANNATAAGRQLNRRVEITVLNAGKS